ncbi:inositol monophosphatase family protein [Pseudomonas putida]|uniref:inositol monophosphatase family protein n=1 Tax=Pseudomonas putida TaxID=303 RepID=UPI0034655118
MKNLNVQQILPFVISAVEYAEQLLAQEYVRPGGRRGYRDKADIDAEIGEVLRAQLLKLLPCDWWGEETGHMLTGNSLCWVVDPNDGASDFLRGIPGSAVSVGLLQGNVPVLGVVHAPVTADGESDCITWAAGMGQRLRNGTSIRINLSQRKLDEHSLVMVSTAASGKPSINRELCSPGDFHPMPSIACRLARVAAGDGVCGVSLFPVSAHDVAAGNALLVGAHGVLVNEQGFPLKYQTEGEMLRVSNRCFGGAPRVCADLVARDWSKVFAKDAV